ncbi:hypothetical protein AMTR_s00065p00209240 [Amborella trichopoda]|uniref:Uncharacterized protein n=1 Tax=Amborella trichopoda TaxID=13333 RepID=U5DE59_AMBTC|nr:hypothetical protein AMTR_s00065p00209240 [Amborella trichopoda]
MESLGDYKFNALKEGSHQGKGKDKGKKDGVEQKQQAVAHHKRKSSGKPRAKNNFSAYFI